MVLFGTVFALQGANILTDSPVMSGNPTYIYVGAALAILGLLLLVAGAMRRPKGATA